MFFSNAAYGFVCWETLRLRIVCICAREGGQWVHYFNSERDDR